MSVLDLCTGSGAVALSLAYECPALEVTASDISEAALKVAADNAARIFCDRESAPLHFVHSDLFAAIPRAHRFDLITANPPYVESAVIETLAPEVRREPRLALDGGADGLALLRRIIDDAPAYLRTDGGGLIMEAQSPQMDALAALLRDAGFHSIKAIRDLAGIERVIRAEPRARD